MTLHNQFIHHGGFFLFSLFILVIHSFFSKSIFQLQLFNSNYKIHLNRLTYHLLILNVCIYCNENEMSMYISFV